MTLTGSNGLPPAGHLHRPLSADLHSMLLHPCNHSVFSITMFSCADSPWSRESSYGGSVHTAPATLPFHGHIFLEIRTICIVYLHSLRPGQGGTGSHRSRKLECEPREQEIRTQGCLLSWRVLWNPGKQELSRAGLKPLPGLDQKFKVQPPRQKGLGALGSSITCKSLPLSPNALAALLKEGFSLRVQGLSD